MNSRNFLKVYGLFGGKSTMFRDPMQSVYTMACVINVSPSPLFNYLVFPSVS